MRFKARLVPTGTWAFLHFPFDVVKTFGTKARVPVCGTINGFPFRSSIMPMDGRHVMCINRAMQAGAKIKPGDTAQFVMQRDEQPRTVTVPQVLKKVLAQNKPARAAFEKLSYSHQKEYATWIADAKQAATVQRRLAKLIPMLLAKQTRNPKA